MSEGDIDVVVMGHGPNGEVVLVKPWPARIYVTDEFIAWIGPQWVSHGDGLLRFTLANADALYGWQGALEDGVSVYELIRGEVRE